MKRESQIDHQGFTLVEIMVALVVLALGMTALMKFQGELIKNASQARQTTEALTIAEDKMDSLRAYADSDEYSLISDSTTPVTVNGVNNSYQLSWSVINCYAGGATPADQQNICLDDFGEEVPADWSLGSGNDQMYKAITLEVAWDQNNDGQVGAEEEVQLVSALESANMQKTVLPPTDGDTSDIAGDSALTKDTLGDEVQIQVDTSDNQSRQAGKPLPDVVASGQRENTLVAFDVITYSPLAGDEVAVNLREEFLNVSCECELKSEALGREPGHVQWNQSGSFRYDKSGAVITKLVGEATDNNAADVSGLCDICCRDHHDDDNSLVRYDGKLDEEGNHAHYDSSGAEVGVGGIYFESCRFKRIDGLLRVFQDWQLKDITTFANSDINGDNTELENAYVSYVSDLVLEPADAEKSTVNGARQPIQTAVNQQKQLQARGVYIDNVYDSEGNLSTGDNSYQAYAGDDKLEQTPFAEVNLTLLADWLSDKPINVSVTNDELDTVSSEENYFSNFYSRGRITGQQESSEPHPIVYASIEPGTDGITDNANTDRALDLNAEDKPFSGIEVEVAGEASIFTISGNLFIDVQGKKPDVSIIPSDTCTPDKDGGQEVYACNVLEGENIIISVKLDGQDCDNSTQTFNNVTADTSHDFVIDASTCQ